MELDFKSVKALSSPTRVKILHKILEKEATPTQLSGELDKSKSTISSHLSKLHTAGLVEKDKKEGRKRVCYSPTRKARAIVKGKERRVQFTLASSALSMMVALIAIGSGTQELISSSGSDQAVGAMTMAQESAASEAPSTLLNLSPEILLFTGAGLLGVSVVSFIYGITVKKLSAE